MTSTAQRSPNWPSGETDDAAEWAVAASDSLANAARRGFRTDSRVADELLRRALDPAPGGMLHAWLCNAIETGRSFGAAQEARTGHYAASMAAALGDDWRDEVQS